MTPDPAIKAVAALSDDTRRGMYVFIRAARQPVTRDEAAASVGISRKLAAFHLDKLVDAGLRHALLFGFAIFGYVQRTGIAIAADRMLPELGLTRIQFGWLLNAFLIAYTALQVPGALVGQWFGPRRTLEIVGLVSAHSLPCPWQFCQWVTLSVWS